jgi:hypothetical protein
MPSSPPRSAARRAVTAACVALSATFAAAQPAIVLPPDATPSLTAAARELSQYLQQATGHAYDIATEPGSGLSIHVGPTDRVQAAALDTADLGTDGFLLTFLDDKNFAIVGGGPTGTACGVYEFLERVVGVRWLMPDPHGTVVPRRRALPLPSQPIRSQPVFTMREISGFESAAEKAWARRHRERGRIEYHHNLFRLFPPQQDRRRHPEFFPTRDGQRILPSGGFNWQPDFTADGLAETAAERIIAYFRRHPNARSYSLGINDSNRFDRSPDSVALDGTRPNRYGLLNASDSYYRWCNAVAERVTQVFPDKQLGLLAYNNVAEPPADLTLHPALVPFLTEDRLKWAVPQQQQAGHALTTAWNAAADRIGWYDYAYGDLYLIPRIYWHQQAAYLRYAAAQGVQYYKAELYPNWGEGPKAYVLMKLLWDPHADVDALVRDWTAACVGPAAAPALQEYYAFWHNYWTQRLLADSWLTTRHQYLPFYGPEYMDPLTSADVDRLRDLMTTVVTKAETPAQRHRAERLFTAFRFYEANMLAYKARAFSVAEPLDTESAALAQVAAVIRYFQAHERRHQLVRQYRGPFSPRLKGRHWVEPALWSLTDWALRSPRVRDQLRDRQNDAGPQGSRAIRDLLAVATSFDPQKAEPLSKDPALDDPGRGPWFFDRAGGGSIGKAQRPDLADSQVVVVQNAEKGGLYQSIPIEPGIYLARVRVYVPSAERNTGHVDLGAVKRTADSTQLPTPNALLKPVPGRWNTLAVVIRVEPRERDRVANLFLGCTARGWQGGEILIDDLALYRVRAASPTPN